MQPLSQILIHCQLNLLTKLLMLILQLWQLLLMPVLLDKLPSLFNAVKWVKFSMVFLLINQTLPILQLEKFKITLKKLMLWKLQETKKILLGQYLDPFLKKEPLNWLKLSLELNPLVLMLLLPDVQIKWVFHLHWAWLTSLLVIMEEELLKLHLTLVLNSLDLNNKILHVVLLNSC